VAIQTSVKEQQEEVLVVTEAYAVVDPRAVVIHLKNACAANAAMVTAVRLVLNTPLAMTAVSGPLPLVCLVLHHVAEDGAVSTILRYELPRRVLVLVWYRPWMDQNARDVANDQHGRDGVENHELCSAPKVPGSGHSMVRHVDHIEPRDERANEEHGEKLDWLSKAGLPFVKGIRFRHCG
jgi:hypothetical protein